MIANCWPNGAIEILLCQIIASCHGKVGCLSRGLPDIMRGDVTAVNKKPLAQILLTERSEAHVKIVKSIALSIVALIFANMLFTSLGGASAEYRSPHVEQSCEALPVFARVFVSLRQQR